MKSGDLTRVGQPLREEEKSRNGVEGAQKRKHFGEEVVERSARD